jgi:hypothetical protein
MTQQICTGRWIDNYGRTHNFEIESDRAERSHIIDLVEAMYPAKKVFVNSVRPKKTESQVKHEERIAAINEERNNRPHSQPTDWSNSSNSGNESGSVAEFNRGPASSISFAQMGVAAGLVASAMGLFLVWALLPLFGVLGGAFVGYKYTSKYTQNSNFHTRFWLVLVISIAAMTGGGYLASGIHNITGYGTSTQQVSQ